MKQAMWNKMDNSMSMKEVENSHHNITTKKMQSICISDHLNEGCSRMATERDFEKVLYSFHNSVLLNKIIQSTVRCTATA